ncbi:hypothetical protein GF374_00830, partial [Candidatus Woesearchaeota archaeon]|nr:hypothetical protein [Candidatus Woesearchaeota archaeon]
MEMQVNKESKLKSVKQVILLSQLLQSSALTKTERDEIVKKTRNKLTSSYEASVLISYLIAKKRFNKVFNSNKKRQKARCVYCGNRIGVKRFQSNETKKRCWLCEYCIKQEDFRDYSEVIKSGSHEVLARLIDVERIADDLTTSGILKNDFKEAWITEEINR